MARPAVRVRTACRTRERDDNETEAATTARLFSTLLRASLEMFRFKITHTKCIYYFRNTHFRGTFTTFNMASTKESTEACGGIYNKTSCTCFYSDIRVVSILPPDIWQECGGAEIDRCVCSWNSVRSRRETQLSDTSNCLSNACYIHVRPRGDDRAATSAPPPPPPNNARSTSIRSNPNTAQDT